MQPRMGALSWVVRKGNAYISGQAMLICSTKDWSCPAGRMILGARNMVPRVRRQIPEVPFKGKCWNYSKVFWHFSSCLSLSTPKHGTIQTFRTYKTFWAMKDSRFYHELSGVSQPPESPWITWTAAFFAISWLCCSQSAWNQLMH